MVTCKICKLKFKVITHKHLKKHTISRDQYLERFNLKSIDLTSSGTRDKLHKSLKGKINIGDKNPAKRKEVREKIAGSVKKLWDEGNYSDRVNGMKGVFGELSSQYKPEIHEPAFMAEKQYNEFLGKFQPIGSCIRCGSDQRKMNVHHIDEDTTNFLISNLEALCVPCHTVFHYEKFKLPFMSIGKVFSFASAHFLPDYDGLCKNLHGHEWKLEVVVERRVDPHTHMVMDFSHLKQVVEDHVIKTFDHSLLNDTILHPTAENILIYVWEKLMFEGFLKGIKSISLWETETSKATLDKQGMLSVYSTKIEDYLYQYSRRNHACS